MKKQRRKTRIKKQVSSMIRLVRAEEYLIESYKKLYGMFGGEQKRNQERERLLLLYLAFAVKAAGGKVEIDLKKEVWKKMWENGAECPLLVEENKEKKTLSITMADSEKY